MPSFNTFFSKTVDELKIPNVSNYLLHKTNDPFKKNIQIFIKSP